MFRKSVGLLILPLLVIAGDCAAAPANATTSYASSLGDRSSAGLEELVVSLPLRGSNAPYHNLHITLAVLTNPMRETSGSASDVAALVRRLDVRIGSQLSSMLSQAGPQSIEGSGALREQVVKEAEKVLSAALQGWKYAADYKVEVVVHSMYWTDASIGKVASTTRGWL